MAGRTFAQMLRDRLSKRGWYDTPAYWDMKAETYSGLARSNWPSNTFNRHWDARQMELIDEVLGDVSGLEVADIACGTGRASRHLARRGARVTGLDFAERALEAARRETEAEGLAVSYRAYDALSLPPPEFVGRFDVGLTISCLAMACADERTFDRALGHVASLVKSGGLFLFLEPIHTSRLLKRILRMSVEDWIEHARAHGLTLVTTKVMGFVPVRLVLAFRDWPDAVVEPAFWVGEKLLEQSSFLEPLSDYKCLLFRHA
jgi:2-polyprenyl-3-methyl-5-hydroxy-6-metoxy-1,4-benzoquinol methylase